jgi:hypothetical protein
MLHRNIDKAVADVRPLLTSSIPIFVFGEVSGQTQLSEITLKTLRESGATPRLTLAKTFEARSVVQVGIARRIEGRRAVRRLAYPCSRLVEWLKPLSIVSTTWAGNPRGKPLCVSAMTCGVAVMISDIRASALRGRPSCLASSWKSRG